MAQQGFPLAENAGIRLFRVLRARAGAGGYYLRISMAPDPLRVAFSSRYAEAMCSVCSVHGSMPWSIIASRSVLLGVIL